MTNLPPEPPPPPHDPRRRAAWSAWLGVNSSTAALLAAILLLTMATELWSPLAPEYIKSLRRGIEAGRGAAGTILLVGLYGFCRDLLEAANYYAGGVIGGRLNTRRSLLLFNLLPLAGLGLLMAWRSAAAVFVAVPLVFVWDSMAGPAIITVVGSSVDAPRRTMVFSLQAIVRRGARLAAYGLTFAAVVWLGRESGFRWAVGMGVAMLLGAVLIQYRYMQTSAADAQPLMHAPAAMLRRFDPQLRRLLVSDIFARWAEGLPRELIILYCIPLLATDRDLGAARFATLLAVQAATNVLLYVFIGPLASRAGLAKKPFIGLTFLFFAAFPIALATLGPALGYAGLVLAYVVGGLREIGEPARKAMISELVDPANRTQFTSLYWAARGVAVMPAGLIGALIWIASDALRPGCGARAALWTAGVVGVAGAAWFHVRFGRTRPAGGAQGDGGGTKHDVGSDGSHAAG